MDDLALRPVPRAPRPVVRVWAEPADVQGRQADELVLAALDLRRRMNAVAVAQAMGAGVVWVRKVTDDVKAADYGTPDRCRRFACQGLDVAEAYRFARSR